MLKFVLIIFRQIFFYNFLIIEKNCLNIEINRNINPTFLQKKKKKV